MTHGRWVPRLALIVSCLAAAMAEGAEGEYKLGPQDRLRIGVHEWRPARGEPYEWTALKGEFTINSAGMLSLPLIGEVRAATATPNQLAAIISDRLQARVGLAQRPDTAVEILQYRPFYILGVVSKPGDYPYRPGLTVLQAVGVAGGFYRPFDPGVMRINREAITSRGDLRLLDAERDALLARRARLQAELNDTETIPTPPELAGRQAVASVMQAVRGEQTILTFRREALRAQLASLEKVKALLLSEVDALRVKDAAQERQLTLARRELETINGLVGKGLAVTQRLLGAEQTVTQLESTRQDLQLAILRARQDIGKTDRDALDLRNKRQTEVSIELRQLEAKLQDVAGRFDVAERLIYDTEVTAPQLFEDRARDEAASPVYSILRRDGEQAHELAATESTAVEPGDIVKVGRRSSASDGAGSAARITPGSSTGSLEQAGPSPGPGAIPDTADGEARPVLTPRASAARQRPR